MSPSGCLCVWAFAALPPDTALRCGACSQRSSSSRRFLRNSVARDSNHWIESRLQALFDDKPLPEKIRSDKGPSYARVGWFRSWCEGEGVRFDYLERSKLMQNPHRRKLRRPPAVECLHAGWSRNLRHDSPSPLGAATTLRPPSALGQWTPIKFANRDLPAISSR